MMSFAAMMVCVSIRITTVTKFLTAKMGVMKLTAGSVCLFLVCDFVATHLAQL